MNYEWAVIPRENTKALWPIVCPMLRKVCERSGGDLTEEFLRNGLELGMLVLWVYGSRLEGLNIQGCAITRLFDFEAKRTMEIVALAGQDLLVRPEAIYLMEDYAKRAGATELLWYGRPGLKRVFESFGYKHKYTLMAKSLIDDTVH